MMSIFLSMFLIEAPVEGLDIVRVCERNVAPRRVPEEELYIVPEEELYIVRVCARDIVF